MSILQRKAQAGKQEHQARAMTVPKALRVSVAKIADQVFDMSLVVIGITRETCEGDSIADKLDDQSMLMLLDGPRGVAGGAMLGPELVAAMIQQQTTGTVSPTVPEGRPLTSTDAALCAPLVDALFQRAHGLLETDEDRRLLSLHRFGARVETPRLFGLALEAAEYHVFKLTLDIAGGAFQSGLTLLLPVYEYNVDLDFVERDDGAVPAALQTLDRTMMDVKADLTAILGRVRMPLSRLERLRQGDELVLRPDAFDMVEIKTVDGRTISRGAMGQLDGRRAVQLSSIASSKEGAAGGLKDDVEMGPPGVQMGGMDLQTPPALPGLGDPGAAATDDLPGLPDLPDLPDAPDLPDLPDLDSAGDAPALPDLPAGGDLPDLPDLPDLGSAEDAPALPDLPDLDAGGDLPDLPDLPDLDGADELPPIPGLADLKSA